MQNSTIQYFIRIHKELHGKNANIEDITKDIFQNTEGVVFDKIKNMVEKEMNKKYGLFIGRCQPFSLGHNSVIQEIIRDGKIPIMFLGSINVHNERNPLSYEERKFLINEIYPDIIIVGIEDCDCWETWQNNLEKKISSLKISKEDCTLYAHTKPEDSHDFEFDGKEYFNESYTVIFSERGFDIKHLEEKCCSLGRTIHASDIRKDEEIAKRNLDARIYISLKNIFNWWK